MNAPNATETVSASQEQSVSGGSLLLRRKQASTASGTSVPPEQRPMSGSQHITERTRSVPTRSEQNPNQPSPNQPSPSPQSGSEPNANDLANRDQQQYIEHLKQRLRQSQALAALGELTSTATHEFNNVLMTVINYAQLGVRHRDDATRDKALAKILEASQRAAKITKTILAQAKNRSASLEPTELGPIIEDTLVLLERELNKYRIIVTKEIASDVDPVIASGNDLQRVLLNLIINARQAMGQNGELVIRLRNSSETGFVELVVRDSGSGIPPATLPHIFEPFFSTKSGPDESGKGGTGLGLAACKEIIDAHQGRIRVDSSLGKGTAFTIRLPKAA